MKILQRITVILFALVLVAFIGTHFYRARFVDSVPPVFSYDANKDLYVPVHYTERDLLQGLTATDDRDGNVTDKIMIKGVSHLITKDTAQVSYIVIDHSNNMATCKRTIHYTDYEKPQFKLTRPLVFHLNEEITILERLSAVDVIDGDLTDKICITARDTIRENSVGLFNVSVQVTNSLGDTESITLPLYISNNFDPTQIRLSKYIDYVDTNADFDPSEYLLQATNPDGLDIPTDHIRIHSTVNTKKAGTYNVAYSYQSDVVYLTVVVR